MSDTTPKQQTQDLKKCITDCKHVVNDMQTLSKKMKSSNNVELQSTLKESIHHLEMCIHECDYASNAVT